MATSKIKEFLTDDEMAKLESNKTQDFISDDEMAKLEADTAEKPKEKSILGNEIERFQTATEGNKKYGQPLRDFANVGEFAQSVMNIGGKVASDMVIPLIPKPVKEAGKATIGAIGGGLGALARTELGKTWLSGAKQIGEGYKKLPEPTREVIETTGKIGGTVLGGLGLKQELKPVGTAIKSVMQKVMRPVDEALGEIAENRGAISEEALRLAGTKEGRELLKKNKGQAYEIGQELVKSIYNPIEKLPEAKRINEILPKLPAVKADNIISALGEKIVQNPAPEFEKINTKIGNTIDWINNTAIRNGGVLNSGDLMNIRSQLDELLVDSWGRESNTYITALKNARHEIRNSLIEAAQNSGKTEYITQMESLAKKLDLTDRIKDRLGSDVRTGEGRAESFVRNLMNQGKSNVREILADYDDVFGTDILKRANASHLSDQLNKKGKLPLLSNWNTGAGGNILERATIGSPKVMSKILTLTGKLGGREPSIVPNMVIGKVGRGLSEYKPNLGYRTRKPFPVKLTPSKDFDDPFYKSLLTPTENKERLTAKKFEDLNPAPEYPDYNPDELLTPEEMKYKYDTEQMDLATRVGKDLQPYHDAGMEQAFTAANDLKMSMKRYLGFRGEREVKMEKLSPRKQMEINQYAHEITNNPDMRQRFVESGLIAHDEKVVSPDDVIQWMNEAQKPKSRLSGMLGNERGSIGVPSEYDKNYTRSLKNIVDYSKKPKTLTKKARAELIDAGYSVPSNDIEPVIYDFQKSKETAQNLSSKEVSPSQGKVHRSEAGVQSNVPLSFYKEYWNDLKQELYNPNSKYSKEYLQKEISETEDKISAISNSRGNIGLKMLAGTSAAGLGALGAYGALRGKK